MGRENKYMKWTNHYISIWKTLRHPKDFNRKDNKNPNEVDGKERKSKQDTHVDVNMGCMKYALKQRYSYSSWKIIVDVI
jgi:hypothetical protein